MSDIQYTNPRHDGWWAELDLRYRRTPVVARHENVVERAALAVLAVHPPISFAGGAEGGTLTASQLKELVDRAVEDAHQTAEHQRESDAAERRRFGWAMVEEALTGPDADQLVAEGRWTGFTWGEATAWCWNLFQYEPHGFVLPGAQVRHEAMQTLQAGGLPEVFGYPERARELAERGLTPRDYRRHKEALGANTFTAADVRRR